MAEQALLDRLTQLESNIANTVKAEVKAAIDASRQVFTEEAAEACSQQLDELSAKAAKIARKNIPGSFKKDENKHVFTKGTEVLESIEEAERHLGKEKVDRALESLKSGKTVIKTLLKHVKLADREELGWEVIKHYDSDDLLSGSDDEKAWGRARRSAAAEQKKIAAPEAEKSTATGQKRRAPPANSASRSGSSNSSYVPGPSRGDSSRSYTQTFNCTRCGRNGHLARYCRF